MAKLDGIDPRKGRKTLGQAMKDLIADEQTDADTELAFKNNHGESGKDNQVARGVLARNTYPASENSLQESQKAVPYKDARELNQGLVDIAPAGLKAVQDVARDVMSGYNDYIPSEVHGESTGGRRGDHLQSSQTNEAETFIQKLKDLGPIQQDLAAINFDLLSGGGASDGAGLSSFLKKQGGFFTAAQIQEMIDKIGAGSSDAKKSLLLAAVNGENGTVPNERPSGVIAGNVHDRLDEINRYAPSLQSPYIKNPTSADEKAFFKDGLYSVQVGAGKLGVYSKDGKGVHTIDLSKMAMQLMLQAQSQGFLGDMVTSDFADGGMSFLYDLAALVPGITQIGAARVEQAAMRIKSTHTAGEIYGDSSPTGANDLFPVDSGQVNLGAGPSSKTAGTQDARSAGSYGNMNSFIEPFDGAMPFGMFFIVLYSLIGVLILSLLVEGIKGTLDIDSKDVSAVSNVADPSSLSLGFNSRGGGGDDIGSLFFKLFGLPRLDFPSMTCLVRGCERFYDIPSLQDLITGSAGFEEVLESAVNLALAPGYYATITKQILRDFEQITEAVLAVGQNASVFNVIAGIFKVVESLFSSFTFRYFVFLMNLGNIDIMSRKAFGAISTGQLVATVDDRQKAANAKLPKTAYTRMRLSRFGGSSNPLGLQFHPAVFNVNTFSLRAGLGGGGYTNVDKENIVDAKTIAGDLSKSRLMSKDRITKEQLHAVEDALDVEYMPFYIHDLRTDEVFSMPAFISGFSEDFSPEYNESHGYGRTDPVLIYSKTRRNMQIDFRLVAFSRSDHDYMWFIINKLVAMCYPQRSAGQKRVVDDKFFIQPFSQVPTASPMVRLRLGEVLKSNYSKISLARFFGLLGAPGRSNIAGDIDDTNTTPFAHEIAMAENMETILAQTDLSDGEDPGLKLVLMPGQTIKLKTGGSTISCVVQNTPSGDDVENQGGLVVNPTDVRKALATEIVGGMKPTAVVVTATIAEKGIFDDIEDAKKKLAPLGPAAVKQLFPDDDLLAMDLGNIPTIKVVGTFVLSDPENQLGSAYKFDKVTLREKAGEDTSAINPASTENVDFMKAENNPVVASFEASRGRGLAGFITSLALDYSESQWEVDPGNRAPQSVSISMSFSPIHDLPLGMDADGNLLAPSHPVGSFNLTDPYNDMDDAFGKALPTSELAASVTEGFATNLGSRKDVNMD